MKKDNIIDMEEYKYFNSPEYKSDELLDAAFEATTKSKAIKLAKQALELNPNNIDAESLIAEYEENIIKKLKKYEAIVEKATKLLEEQEMFSEETIGVFWGIIETRPYMRARYNKILILKELGRYTEAIKECEELLKLCESDNMGVRYILMGLYCVLEKFDECVELFKKYDSDSCFMLFPMAILYFKKGDYKKAKQYLKKVEEQNEFVLDFLLDENGEYSNLSRPEYYSWGSEEEAFLVIYDLFYLLSSIPSFKTFIEEEYRK